MVKVSFIVPIYNQEKYLRECLESLINQKEKYIEIILVNDGSTDKSLEVCMHYKEMDNRIIVIDQENQGACIARNTGLNKARGQYICFVDGDDWVDDELSSFLCLHIDKGVDIIFYSYKYVFSQKVKLLKHKEDCFEINKKDFTLVQLATFNRIGNYEYNINKLDTVSVADKAYRKDFLLEHDLRFIPGVPKLQDLIFNLWVYEYAESGIFFNKLFYNYRINDASISRGYQPDIVGKFEIIHQHLDTFMKIKNDKSGFQEAYYERIATHLRTCVVLKFCNKENKESYRIRKDQFLETYYQQPYFTAMKKVKISNFTIKETALSFFIKYRIFFMCHLLCRANDILDEMKKEPSKKY